MRIRRPGRPLLDDPTWIELLERYVGGATAAELAREYKVSIEAIAWQARNRGYRKMDRPDAVYRWRQPPPITAQPDRMETLAFEDDPDDPEGSAERALGLAARAAREGRLQDHAQLSQAARSILRTGRVRGLVGSPSPSCGGTSAQGSGWGGVGRPHPGSADASASLPISGEGEPLVLRAAQTPPEGDWGTWLFLGGRGAGKTLAGAAWVADQAEAMGKGGRLALIGATLHDAREVMIGGPSGVMSLPRWHRDGVWPVYEPSRRRLRFPGGAEAFVFSAEEPERLRGPQFGAAWADEFCAWRRPEETLALLRMGLRLSGPVRASESLLGRGQKAPPFRPDAARDGGDDMGAQAVSEALVGHGQKASPSRPDMPFEASGSPPQLVITTTPRPIGALKRLRAEAGCVETHAGTKDNAAHLAAGFIEGLEALYGGTRRAAQEMEGLVVEAEGALFSAEMLAGARVEAHSVGGYRPSACLSPHPAGGYRPSADLSPGTPEDVSAGSSRATRDSPFERVLVGVDPTASAGGDACGIVVVGRRRREDGTTAAVVLADRSMAGLSPEGWARRAVRAALDFDAAAIVAEVNQGGEMVRAVLRAAADRLGASVPLTMVRAADGKRARAEPVAALYEQGRVTHAGVFAALEEELMAFGGEDEGRFSLDRADALVWAVSALMLKQGGEGPRIRSLGEAVGGGGLSGGYR